MSLQKRVHPSPQQTLFLNQQFFINNKPTSLEKKKIAQITGLEIRFINLWFQNRRSKKYLRPKPYNLLASFKNPITLQDYITAVDLVKFSQYEVVCKKIEF